MKSLLNVVLIGAALFGFCVPTISAREDARACLCRAVQANSYEAIRRAAVDMSKYGGDLNKRDIIPADFQEEPNDSDYGEPPTLLVVAIQKNKKEAVKALLDAGADIDQKHRDHTVLCLAVEYQNKEIAAYLLERGARFKVLDADEHNPLSAAIITGQVDVTKLLIHAGANVCDGSAGAPPIHLLKQSKQAEFRRMARQIEVGGNVCR